MEKQKQVILGIDIGGTNVAFGLIGKEEKKILWKDSEPILQFSTAEEMADRIGQKIQNKFASNKSALLSPFLRQLSVA